MPVRVVILFFVLLCPSLCAEGRGADEPAWNGPWKGIPELVPILASIPEGKEILAKAQSKDPDCLKRIKIGSASFTESTFARTYSLIDGKEQIDLHHEITLNHSLSLSDAIVDLAHELVHFTEKEMLDPYRPGFALKEFVRRGIEGRGGELAALKKECQVAWALQKKYGRFPEHRLCAPYRDRAGRFHTAKARADYFALGSWWAKAPAGLKETLPEVNAGPVVFTSSFARKPYPIALAEEFQATLEAACANNRRKYKLISAQAEGGRSPASHQLERERMRLKAYERLYCSPRAVYEEGDASTGTVSSR